MITMIFDEEKAKKIAPTYWKIQKLFKDFWVLFPSVSFGGLLYFIASQSLYLMFLITVIQFVDLALLMLWGVPNLNEDLYLTWGLVAIVVLVSFYAPVLL